MSTGARPVVFSRLGAHRRRFGAGVFFLLCTNVASNAAPWIMKQIVDSIEAGSAAGVPRLALLLAGVAMAGAAARVLSRINLFNTARDIEYELRNELFAHLIRLPPSFYRDATTGDLMSRVTNDVSYIRLLYGPGILNMVNTVCAYAMALPLLLVIDARLTVYCVLPIPIMLFLSRGMARRIQTRQRALQDEMSRLTTRLHESLSGISVVKAYAMEDREAEAFAVRNDVYLERGLDLAAVRSIFMPVVGAIAGSGALIVLLGGGHAVASGRMSLGDLVAFLGYLAMLTWPTLALGWVISSWHRGIAALGRVDEVLAVQPSIDDPAHPVPLDAPKGALEIRSLSLAYDESAVLDDVSFSLAAGGSLGIVGRTGSGKSTLIKALCRLTEVPPDTVFLDGVDVCDLTLDCLRGAVALVPQESFLFSTTLLRNIAFTHPDPEDSDVGSQVREVTAAAALDGDIDRFPLGYETLVGERGITLSGGQKQRAAIARALFADRPVLILDDACSSVDSETERAILQGVRAAALDRSLVVVSHRMTAVCECDEIVVLEAGRIAARGTHGELVAEGGWYADMWRVQQAEQAA